MASGSRYSTLEPNPYPPHRTVGPEWTLCETCDRTIRSRDWGAHQNGRRHREAAQQLVAAERVQQMAGNPEQSWGDEANEAAQQKNGDGDAGWVNARSNGSAGFNNPSIGQAGGSGCRNCGEDGHFARECPNPKRGGGDNKCRNCGQPGHFARECTEPRTGGGGGGGGSDRPCYNCNEVGHIARECPNPRVERSGGGGGGGGGPCFNCGEVGHTKRECTKIMCTNCETEGHTWRECPEPKDWSKVTCSNCKQKGHTKVRCKEPPADDGGFGSGGGGFGSGDGGFGGGFDTPAPSGNWDDGAAGGTGDAFAPASNDWEGTGDGGAGQW